MMVKVNLFVLKKNHAEKNSLSSSLISLLLWSLSGGKRGWAEGGAGDCFSIDVWSTRLFSFSVILHCQANFIPSFTVSIKVIACFTTFALLGDCESMMWPLACPRVLGDCWHVCVPAM